MQHICAFWPSYLQWDIMRPSFNCVHTLLIISKFMYVVVIPRWLLAPLYVVPLMCMSGASVFVSIYIFILFCPFGECYIIGFRISPWKSTKNLISGNLIWLKHPFQLTQFTNPTMHLFWMVQCGICNCCILGFVRLVCGPDFAQNMTVCAKWHKLGQTSIMVRFELEVSFRWVFYDLAPASSVGFCCMIHLLLLWCSHNFKSHWLFQGNCFKMPFYDFWSAYCLDYEIISMTMCTHSRESSLYFPTGSNCYGIELRAIWGVSCVELEVTEVKGHHGGHSGGRGEEWGVSSGGEEGRLRWVGAGGACHW